MQEGCDLERVPSSGLRLATAACYPRSLWTYAVVQVILLRAVVLTPKCVPNGRSPEEGSPCLVKFTNVSIAARSRIHRDHTTRLHVHAMKSRSVCRGRANIWSQNLTSIDAMAITTSIRQGRTIIRTGLIDKTKCLAHDSFVEGAQQRRWCLV